MKFFSEIFEPGPGENGLIFQGKFKSAIKIEMSHVFTNFTSFLSVPRQRTVVAKFRFRDLHNPFIDYFSIALATLSLTLSEFISYIFT